MGFEVIPLETINAGPAYNQIGEYVTRWISDKTYRV